ncbi:alpha/beta hydrolase, partial [Actinoplanes sp. NPDC051633]|uniref:WXG100-like domain-containing protein n=1 Tax=Actinoplanes sp. NPDC051633 TaxID=3155670 RepID=UPI00342C5B09
MPIPEPADALWAEVSQLTRWPDADEDAVRTMAAGWRAGGDHFTSASSFDMGPVADGWPDAAGQAFHGRTTEGLRTAASTGAGMAELAGHADAFAAEVTGVKNGIHELMAVNQAGFAQAAAMPADVRAGFVRQVAGMVDTMKAEAAARIAAARPAQAGQPGQPAQFAGQQPPDGPLYPDEPRAVKIWWDSLTEGEQNYFRAHPETIGNLDGVPINERNAANQQLLRVTIADLKQQEAAAPGSTGGRLAALEDLQKRLWVQAPGGNQLHLIAFDNAGDGQAVVSIGNPDTAKNVATLVPGITNELNNIGHQIDRATTLRPDNDTATVVWLDYNTPEALIGAEPGANSLTPLSDLRARDGADDLARFQTGLRATHMGTASNNVVVAHSYGTTVAGIASHEYGLNADKLVFVASTNPGVDNVSELNLVNADGSEVPADQVAKRVYATTTDDDWLAHFQS